MNVKGFQIALLGALTLAHTALAVSVDLSKEGKAVQSVVVAAGASEESRAAAQSLAAMLSRISGAPFSVSEGDGSTGIVVGSVAEFPQAVEGSEFDPKDVMRREEYRMRSHAKGLSLIGATSLGARHATWDLLQRLGYRQFFPGQTWEVIPNSPNLSIEVDEKQAPAFTNRKIWYEYGSFRLKDALGDWAIKNRGGEGFPLSTGHAYGAIIRHNLETFKEHPEYLALINGNRVDPSKSFAKFCISNPALRELVAKNAVERVRESEPRIDSISIDPSDAGGWCQCEECAKLGSISDQQTLLANTVAEAVTKEFPGTRVGMYAYNFHSAPPTIPVNPAIVVSVATNLTRGGFTFEQMVDGWHAKGATIGTRGYFSVWTWNRSLPGGAQSAKPQLLANFIQRNYELGSRFMNTQAADDWATSGLGYYVAARTLWDLEEAKRVPEIIEDFLAKAFGPAKETMRKFYVLINSDKRIPNSEDKIARLYHLLQEASEQTTDPAILQRLNELTLATRYFELYLAYAHAPVEAGRQEAYETMVAHALRMAQTGMVASVPVVRDLPRRDKNITVPDDLKWANKKKSPLFHQEPYTDAEIAAMRKEGIKANAPAGFDAATFSEELVPATNLNADSDSGIDAEMGKFGFHQRYQKSFYTWIAPDKGELVIQSNAPRIYRLYSVGETEEKVAEVDRTDEKKVEAPETREIRLKTPQGGLHRLEISAGNGPSEVTWADGIPMTLVPNENRLWSPFSLYFYVPKGTKIVGGYAGSPPSGAIMDPAGNKLFKFSEMPRSGGHFKAEVPPGMDGKFWKITDNRRFELMTVPNMVARSPRELMLPAEVVEADRKKEN